MNSRLLMTVTASILLLGSAGAALAQSTSTVGAGFGSVGASGSSGVVGTGGSAAAGGASATSLGLGGQSDCERSARNPGSREGRSGSAARLRRGTVVLPRTLGLARLRGRGHLVLAHIHQAAQLVATA
jgi:hypothetical protein